jgi:hypothetical protein
MKETSHSGQKLIAPGVYYLEATESVAHRCPKFPEGLKELTFRENDEGPLYWCNGCGYTVDNGVAMAIRLYEAPIS